jgi:DNA-binding transcriptional ArsR family regulator
MEEEKIILDKLSFGALAVDSRVKILKALRERRKTLSELSTELGLSPSSTKEHLEKLVDAALIEKMEEGHKWKYYELTKKGAQLVSPNRNKGDGFIRYCNHCTRLFADALIHAYCFSSSGRSPNYSNLLCNGRSIKSRNK